MPLEGRVEKSIQGKLDCGRRMVQEKKMDANNVKETVRTSADSSLMVNSVHKAFRVLTAFTSTEPRLTLKQVADKLEIDKSTAQRFTHTLMVMGFLDKDPVTKTLGVTVKTLDLAHVYLATSPLVAAAMPYLVHLNKETGETVNLTVLDETETVFVSRIVGNNLLSTGVIIGTRLPAYTTAAGLAMMSVLGVEETKRILDATDLKAYTSQTVYEPDKIVERIREAMTRGYTLSVGDYFQNDISLAAPILSRGGTLLGAMALSVTQDRFTPKEAEAKFAKLILATARSVIV
jgi:DNA-binding IclR family transcriptional regulator